MQDSRTRVEASEDDGVGDRTAVALVTVVEDEIPEEEDVVEVEEVGFDGEPGRRVVVDEAEEGGTASRGA